MNIMPQQQSQPYHFDGSKYSTHSRILALLPQAQGNILDIGCNAGYIGASYQGKASFYGIDSNLHALEQARSHYKEVGAVDLNSKLSIPWNISFDCLVFGDILEHLHAPLKTLQYFVDNHLLNEGRIIISLPNICNLFVRLSILAGNFDYKDSGILDRTHLHFYTLKSAQQFANAAGLSVISTFAGSSRLGAITEFFPWTKSLFATSVVLYCKKLNI